MTNISINSYIKFLKNIGIYSFLQDQPNNYFNINDNKGLNKNLSTIVATDIAARGIDVADLTFVVHYQ